VVLELTGTVYPGRGKPRRSAAASRGDGVVRASVGGEGRRGAAQGEAPGRVLRVGPPVLDRRLLADAPKDRPPGYLGDLRLLHRYKNEGVRAQGAAMRFASLRARYRQAYTELAAEARGQGELPSVSERGLGPGGIAVDRWSSRASRMLPFPTTPLSLLQKAPVVPFAPTQPQLR
jgi:hypothetical protein